MGNINVGRLILGGIVAVIVGDILDIPVDGLWLGNTWNNQLAALLKPALSTNQIIWFDVMGIVVGLVAIWIYVGIRPRFGAGVKTAIYAGLAAWILACLVPNVSFMCISGLFSRHLALYTTLGGLIEYIVGAIAGAALYKEA